MTYLRLDCDLLTRRVLCALRPRRCHAGEGRSTGLGRAEGLLALLCLICTYEMPLTLGTAFSSQEEGSGQGQSLVYAAWDGWDLPCHQARPFLAPSSCSGPFLTCLGHHPARANAVQLVANSRPVQNPESARRQRAFVPLPLAASGTVGRSLAKPRSSGKCWLSDLARMCRKVDFPSTVLVVFSYGKAKQVRRFLCGGKGVSPSAPTHRAPLFCSARPLLTCMAIPSHALRINV